MNLHSTIHEISNELAKFVLENEEGRMVMRAKWKQFVLQRTPFKWTNGPVKDIKLKKKEKKIDDIVQWMLGENVIFYLFNVWWKGILSIEDHQITEIRIRIGSAVPRFPL